LSDTPTTKALNRLAYQFSDSETFKSFLTCFLEQADDLEASNLQLLTERYLETAIGAQLDGIGEIVGLERPNNITNNAGAFGFFADATAESFTTLGDLDKGGPFISIRVSGNKIDDEAYRLLIKATIFKNVSNMTVESTLSLISFTFGGVMVRYILPENLKPEYTISTEIGAFEALLIELLPTLIGLGPVKYISAQEDPFVFAEDTDSNGLGFGDINDSALGGHFAKIL